MEAESFLLCTAACQELLSDGPVHPMGTYIPELLLEASSPHCLGAGALCLFEEEMQRVGMGSIEGSQPSPGPQAAASNAG